MAWINTVAEKLVASNFTDTTKVAMEMGFTDRNQLYRAIQRETGKTYSEWRNSLKKGVDSPNSEHCGDDAERALMEDSRKYGYNIDDVAFFWHKSPEISAFIRRNDIPSYMDMRDSIIAEMTRHAPNYKRIKHNVGNHLAVINPADPHFGKFSAVDETGGSYDLEVATNRFREGVEGLMSKARPFGLERILFIIGNDALHIDNPRRTTTAGTPQDTFGMWWQAFQTAKNAFISTIETLALEAPVSVLYVPSNHDYMSGYMLADSIYSWFHNHPHVSFDDDFHLLSKSKITIRHRKYFVYGSNLLGVTHGDGAKENDLPGLMAIEAKQAWANAKFRYWYLGHLHHHIRRVKGQISAQLSRENLGVNVIRASGPVDPSQSVYIEYCHSQSDPDGWHDRNGYVGMKAMDAFIHHPEFGQVARLTHYF